jgi:isocitrate/isopropylmalate dehydrogenase
MDLNVLILPGDGIGTEVTQEAVRVLQHVCSRYGHDLKLTEGLLGGIAIHRKGTPFPDETAKLAVEADATLMGAVGLPEFDNAPPEKRPEKGLLGIRQILGVFANLRPVRAYRSLNRAHRAHGIQSRPQPPEEVDECGQVERAGNVSALAQSSERRCSGVPGCHARPPAGR